MDDLLKDAIADAKAVRETALENAKIALEEAFTPRLQSMLSKKIQSEMEHEDEDDVDVTEHEKRKEVFNLYENEMVQQQEEEEQVNYKDFDGLDEDWEDFNSA